MRRESLPSPGMLSMGIDLQGRMARAISSVEVNAGQSGGISSQAKQLDNFLVAARAAISAFIDAVLPVVSSRNVGAANYAIPGSGQVAGNFVRIRTSKMLDRSYVPAAAAFALASPAKVISNVQVDGPDVILTVTVPYTAADTTATVAYTAPGAGANGVRDLSGNLLATFAAAAVANTVA